MARFHAAGEPERKLKDFRGVPTKDIWSFPMELTFERATAFVRELDPR